MLFPEVTQNKRRTTLPVDLVTRHIVMRRVSTHREGTFQRGVAEHLMGVRTAEHLLDWINHKLESRLLGEISAISDMQMISP